MPDRDELLRLFGLDDADEGPGPEVLTPPPKGPAPATNPNALVLDDWGRRRGVDLARGHSILVSQGLTPTDFADCLAAAYDPEPELMVGCGNPTKYAFFRVLLETPEFHALHTTTRLDPAASELAAVGYALRLAGLRGDEPAEILSAVGEALDHAEEEVDAYVEALRALGGTGGLGLGAPGGPSDPHAVLARYRKVRGSPSLRAICEQAGRFRRVAQSRQRQKTLHGLDDVVGVELGDDPGRLLPSELALLSVPEAELDTLRRIAEGQALCRAHRAVEPVGKGPILVTVDESGSMRGAPSYTAKALALALAWIAQKQGRWCGLVAYSGDTGERTLALPPGRRDEDGVMAWLEPFIGGGSDLDVPVRELPRIYDHLKAPAGKTDVICITDAICHVPVSIREAFLAWKHKVQARVIVLVIASEAGDLALLADEVHRVPALDPDGEAIGRVLSL